MAVLKGQTAPAQHLTNPRIHNKRDTVHFVQILGAKLRAFTSTDRERWFELTLYFTESPPCHGAQIFRTLRSIQKGTRYLIKHIPSVSPLVQIGNRVSAVELAKEASNLRCRRLIDRECVHDSRRIREAPKVEGIR